MNSKDRHDTYTTKIFNTPSIIGLEDIIMSTDEVNMFRTNSTSLYHQPDNILFDYKHKVIYNVEYKTNNSRKKAVQQLHDTSRYLRMMFRSYDVVNLYVHNNFKVERIS